MELLNGAKSLEKFNQIKEYLDVIKFYDLKFKKESYADSAKIYIHCRMNGITIRSIIDILIAQTAIENNLYLLHNDKDYEYIGRIIKELKFY